MMKTYKNGLRQVVFGSIVVAAAGCSNTVPTRSANAEGGPIVPALSLLSVDFERTFFLPESAVSGSIARSQRDGRVATPSQGRIRRETTGSLPAEIRIDVASMRTTNRTVKMVGSVVLRELELGRTLARLDDFSASGSLPVVEAGSSSQGIVFRGVEDEIMTWLASLDCDEIAGSCGIDLLPDVPEPEPVEDADLDLAALVDDRRPTGVRGLFTDGIDPDAVVAAATPAEAPDLTVMTVGTTVASVGLLNRSGFWLQTPLVSEEQPGKIMDAGTGVMLPVTLIPSGGVEGSGSQLSLAAIAELGREPTDLITIEVLR